MSYPKNRKISLTIVAFSVMLMIAFLLVQIKVFGVFDNADSHKTVDQDASEDGLVDDIQVAKGMYLSLKNDFTLPNFKDETVKQRSLTEFYSLRAFSGAPPVIPHEIIESESLTGSTCIGCHEYGGFTPKFAAYAPIVPHPNKPNCRQCHNPRNQNDLFKRSEWVKYPGNRGFAHLPGSPLVIPHSLQMRENCLSCHSGPAAVSEIRTTHPERINCLQCHVEQNVAIGWVRK